MTEPPLSQLAALRQNSLTVLDELCAKRPTCDLPAPLETLGLFQQRLDDNRYRVLVVGEAKRGKSSFINALIGRPILPTDVDIATSQVILVDKAPVEAYRVRFEDDSVKEIAAGDLPKYGSQVLADEKKAPRLEQIIRWIEVDVPVRFLPDGVSLLDTPGLGSLYAAHSQITQRFVPQADAVIYVLASGEVILQRDLETIGAILDVTPNLFFIQTHIDAFKKEEWQEHQARNEQVLREQFGGKLADPRVWPVSCRLLMKAAETGDPDYEVLSRHRELAVALKVFLFRVASLSRVAAALLVAGQYHDGVREVLVGRVNDLLALSEEQRSGVLQEMAGRKRQFDCDWGERGAKRQALMKSLQQAIAAGKQSLRQALETGGEIDSEWRDRIEKLQSIEAARSLAPTMADQIIETAVKRWQTLEQQVRNHVVRGLEPFVEAAEKIVRGSYTEGGALAREGYRLQTQDDWFEKAKGFRLDMMSAGFIVGLSGTVAAVGLGAAAGASTLVAALVSSAVFPPLAVGAGLAAGVWVLLQGRKGWRRAEENMLEKAKLELRKHLGEVRDQVRRYYFDVDLEADRLQNLVDEHFEHLAATVSEHLQRLAAQRSEEAAREIARLKEQAELDERQRAVRLAELRACLSEWEGLGRSLQNVISEMARLDKMPVALAKPGTKE